MESFGEHISTEKQWSDLELNAHTMQQLREIERLIHQTDRHQTNENALKKLKPGFKLLFYGPSGTGKTLAAKILGKYSGKEVFRIDLRRVVSKYIGETEKNLRSIFDHAENKNWILFFDEADALFGKRSDVRNAHDKYANQEVSYLLQRMEAYEGVTILASNMKSNIDEAFTRRFNAVLHFPRFSINPK